MRGTLQGKKNTMPNFEQIERDFLKIDDRDDSSILKFYYDNINYFSLIDITKKEISQKNLLMLSEIIQSAYAQKDNRLLRKMIKPTINNFNRFSIKYNYDLGTDNSYKALTFHTAIYHFDRKKYYSAIKYFKISLLLDKDNEKLIDFYNVSKYRFNLRLINFIGLLGLTIFVLKYFLKLIIGINGFGITMLGILSATLLIAFGIFAMRVKSPATKSR
ncbi:MAG: hypothetical protein U0T82_07835 [Bacteroidales bacterium]